MIRRQSKVLHVGLNLRHGKPDDGVLQPRSRPSYELNAPKARILLSLALLRPRTPQEIQDSSTRTKDVA